MRTFLAGLVAVIGMQPTTAALGSEAAAQEWQRLGLMRVRDMTPFGLARLDMLPAHAVSAEPGTFAIETTLTHQNTWVRSENVADYLHDRGGGRRRLTGEDVAAIMDFPGDAYLVDGEYGLLDLTLHHRISPHVGVYATIPYFMFGTAFLDGTIEEFHNEFGFSNAGREFVERNRWHTLVKRQNTRLVMNEPPDNGFGDPVLGMRYSVKQNPDGWNLVIETAVKLPRQSAETIISTGSTDYGLQISYQRFLQRNALYLTASAVYYSSDPQWASDRWIPTVVAGWERRLTRDFGMVLQVYGSRSTVQNTNLRELSAHKLQATAGLQWLHNGNVLRVGLTENLRNFNNTPDVGLTVSLARIFGKGPRSRGPQR